VFKEWVSPKQRNQEENEFRVIGTAPFYHTISNKLKSVCNEFDINLMFRYPHKLGKLINTNKEDEKQCKTYLSTHENYTDCEKQIVYEIPFSCNGIYVGQSGKCVNERLTDHANDLDRKQLEGKHIKQHLK
jgi:hypothetical protein